MVKSDPDAINAGSLNPTVVPNRNTMREEKQVTNPPPAFQHENTPELKKLHKIGKVTYLRKPPRTFISNHVSTQNRCKNLHLSPNFTVNPLTNNDIPETRFDRTSFHYNHRNDWKYHQTSQNDHETMQIVRIAPPEKRFIGTIVLHIIDVLNGHRPAKHLQTWMTPPAYQALVRRSRLGMELAGGAAKCTAPKIRRVRIFQPTPNAAEAGVVLYDGRKVRAAALRFEAWKGRWHITEIEVI
ncbi:Rv3235 family protein [Arcanobacterium hippocoleae]|uniref:Rv3235 family protein n=1 Tax=Arcanobacterium hippocoleae TaxID=149017 RepID=UPI00333F05D4